MNFHKNSGPIDRNFKDELQDERQDVWLTQCQLRKVVCLYFLIFFDIS